MGTGLRTVEQVAGRMTVGRAAIAGAGQGAMIGLFFGLLFSLFFEGPDFLGVVLYGLVAGTVFGAVMGYVIGKSVADFHLGGDGHVRLAPWCHPTEGATGVMLETRF